MTWEDLCQYKPQHGWMKSINQDNLTFTLLSNMYCNGQQVNKDITICRNMTWSLRILSQCVRLDTNMGFPVVFPQENKDIDFLFFAISKLEVCTGFSVLKNTESVDKSGNVIGKSESWLKADRHELKHRSVNCSVVVPVTVLLCQQCTRVKKNCQSLNNREAGPPSKYKRETYMSREELIVKLQEKKREQKNFQKREVHERIKTEFQTFSQEDHHDFRDMFHAVSDQVTEKWKENDDMMLLWDSQKKAMASKGPSGRRWHPKVIRMCLSMWTRSPKAYDSLRKSNMLVLPSGRLLQLYKNCVSQRPGFNDDVLEWMIVEAKKNMLQPGGYDGGIVFDEMQIQEDLQLQKVGEETKLVGLVNIGTENDRMQTLIAGIDKAVIATHVLQLVFLGNSGFRFPFAHFPTKEIDAPSLYTLIWQAVKWLRGGGFCALYTCCDGGQANRTFVSMHFPDSDPISEEFTTRNLVTRQPFVFFMDPWHNFKKLRNGIEKSNRGQKSTRCLRLGEGNILWSTWKEAYTFDQKNHSLPIHHRLKPEHFDLTASLRMRNHLATDVLDTNMLYLMQAYHQHKSMNGASATQIKNIEAALTLLTYTSQMIEIFTDKRPFTSVNDERLMANERCLKWLLQWEEDIKENNPDLNTAAINRMLLSAKTRFDLCSMLSGFKQIVQISTDRNKGSSVVAARTNSNIVENIFCQQRGMNGQNDNPRYTQYGPAINSICLGQTAVTTRNNTGCIDQLPFFKPTSLSAKH